MSEARAFEVTRVAVPWDSSSTTNARSDFELAESGRLEPAALLADPAVSVYSIDHANRQVSFVEIEDPGAAVRSPFFYMHQRKTAKRVFLLDWDTFFRLSESPVPPGGILHLYSVGRCGSTLLHHFLNRLPECVCYSEPDAFFQIAMHRAAGRLGYGDAVKLARGTMSLLWHKRPPSSTLVAIKHRGKGIWAWKEFREAVPGARILFLYRNPVPTIESFDGISKYRAARNQWLFQTPGVSLLLSGLVRLGLRFSNLAFYDEHLARDSHREILSRHGLYGYLTLDWISKVDCYRKLSQLAPDSLPLSYEELTTRTPEVLRRLISHCGLHEGSVDELDGILAQDSQEGTRLQRAGRVRGHRANEKSVAAIHSIISRNLEAGPDLGPPRREISRLPA